MSKQIKYQLAVDVPRILRELGTHLTLDHNSPQGLTQDHFHATVTGAHIQTHLGSSLITVNAHIGDTILFSATSSSKPERYSVKIYDIRHFQIPGNPSVVSRFHIGAPTAGFKTQSAEPGADGDGGDASASGADSGAGGDSSGEAGGDAGAGAGGDGSGGAGGDAGGAASGGAGGTGGASGGAGGASTDGWVSVRTQGTEHSMIVVAIRAAGKTIGYVAAGGVYFQGSY